MFENYLNDYYKSKKSVKEICNDLRVSTDVFHKYLKRNNLLPKEKWFSMIDTGVEELNKILKVKYSSIHNRCRGKNTDYYGHYANKDYMTIQEWVLFCNSNKEMLNEMWNEYIQCGRQHKMTISVDRKNEHDGYTVENVEFVTLGFNSWKRTINPVIVTHNGQTRYFMSCEYASLFYNLREQTIGEVLIGSKYHVKGYIVERVTIDAVLRATNTKDIKEYYEMQTKDEKWVNRRSKKNKVKRSDLE